MWVQTGREAYCFFGGTREKIDIKSLVFPRAVALWDTVLHPKFVWPYLLPQKTHTTARLGTPTFLNHAWVGIITKLPLYPILFWFTCGRKLYIRSLSAPLLSLSSKTQIYCQVGSVGVRQQQREGKQKWNTVWTHTSQDCSPVLSAPLF